MVQAVGPAVSGDTALNPRELFRALDAPTPTLSGAGRPYAHFDHAASTPPLASVLDAVNAFVPYYANVHRGHGFKSRYSSRALEQARHAVLDFAGAADATHVAVFTRNTTEAINLLAARWPLPAGAVVIATAMEHHSNDLPWRRVATVLHARVDATGAVDETHLRDLLRAHRGSVAVLAVTAASNVTGIVNPVHRWAAWAHEAGAKIVVDAAQLVPHRRLVMGSPGDEAHLDAVAFSAHKLYAPFGAGVLVAPRGVLAQGEPHLVGGGTVDVVSLDHAVWTGLPDREEAGTPAVIGAVALDAAIRALAGIGWENVAAHEARLSERLARGLATVPGLEVYGRAADRDHLALVAFSIAGVPHRLVGAVLDYEWAIGTRCGCFCAHPFVKLLLRLSDEAAQDLERRVVAGDLAAQPGMVRASIGLATSEADVDRLVEALRAVADGRHAAYTLDHASGDYAPRDGEPALARASA